MKNFPYNSSIDNQIEDLQEVYRLWCEKEWWTKEEAICVFFKINPDHAFHVYESLIRSDPNRRIVKLVSTAISAGSVKNLKIDTVMRTCIAPCKDWLEWALTKFSIKLDDELLLAAGIDTSKHIAREKDTFRPKDEIIMKTKIITAAKIILCLAPRARYSDIRQSLKNTDPSQHLPGEKTFRKWLIEAGIKLFSTNQTNVEIEKIENKLFPLTRISQEF